MTAKNAKRQNGETDYVFVCQNYEPYKGWKETKPNGLAVCAYSSILGLCLFDWLWSHNTNSMQNIVH